MPSTTWTPEEIERLGGRRVMVVGDLILDRYVWGHSERTSPEAPVLVLEYDSEHVLLGGAGNVANNLCAAGAQVIPCGVVGDDDNGAQIRRMMEELGIPIGGVITDATRPTIEKTRMLAGGQQVLRIDRERRHLLNHHTLGRLWGIIAKNAAKCCGIILSDYLKGVLSAELIGEITRLCRAEGLPVVADPKGVDYRRYRGVDFITPNQKEAQAASGVTVDGEESLIRAGRQLLRITRGRGVVITRGHEDTILFLRRGKPFQAPVQSREVYDVSGAGDSFISYFALALFAGHTPQKAAVLGNLAGSLAVQKIGAAPVSREEMIAELSAEHPAHKLKTLQELEGICARLRSQGKRIVMVHGSWDLIHAGHIRFLGQARRLGDVLVVSAYTDRMIRKLKSGGRPFIELNQRAEILSAIDSVDYVVTCDAETPGRLIEALKPAVLAGGKGHQPAEYFFDKMVKPFDGAVRLLPLHPEATTEAVVERIVKSRRK